MNNLLMKILLIVAIISLILINHGCKKTNEPGQINSGPMYLHWGTKYNTLRGVTLTWQSSATEDSIKWGYSPDYESGKYLTISRNEYGIYLHDFTLPPLKPLSQIHYAIKSGKDWSNDRIFSTSGDTLADNFSFIAGSDCHGGDDDHDSDSRWNLMSELVLKEDCDFYLFTGDVVDDDNDWDLWKSYYKNGQNLFENKIIFYGWGNHEYGPLALYNTTLPANEKWYSFSQGNALFISLLTEEDLDIQYQWLRDQLRNTEKEWIIVYFHRPFFTRGSHKDEMDEQRATWWKAFDDYGVDIVMSGHTHSYIRSKPLNLNVSDTSAVVEYGSKPGEGRMSFVLAGLGGKNSRASEDWFAAKAYSGLHYVKFNINGSKLHFDTYSHDGVLIDSLSLYSGNTD